ncbi:hypothetical protein BLOT_007766 [Blomia tropicalis]|nr:hypothetical protein BLOT_007766 [Blomia tropicalis]
MSLPCAKANGPFVVFVVDVVDVIANISIYVDSSNEFQLNKIIKIIFYIELTDISILIKHESNGNQL